MCLEHSKSGILGVWNCYDCFKEWQEEPDKTQLKELIAERFEIVEK